MESNNNAHLVNEPQFLNISTNDVAITPSTFKIRFGFLLVVIFSTSNAYSSNGLAGKFSITNSLMILTRTSGLLIDLTRCPIPTGELQSKQKLNK